MSKSSSHLPTFTSILSLLSIKYPQIANQLTHLRLAVIKWYEGVENELLEKNRAIMSAKYRGNEKLLQLFNNMDSFFNITLRNYSDPNLRVFYTKFTKIKQQFDFIDIGFDKFCQKTMETQTEGQFLLALNFDIDKITKNYQSIKFQLQQAQNRIRDLQYENQDLKNHGIRLTQQLRKDQQQYSVAITDLKLLLEKARDQLRTQNIHMETMKKTNLYRSNPEIHNKTADIHISREIIKNLLLNAKDDSFTEHEEAENEISIEEDCYSDKEILRFLYSQSLTLEEILQSAANYDKMQENYASN